MYIQEGMRVIAEYYDLRCGTAVCADSEWVLVEFDDPFPGGHNGNSADGVEFEDIGVYDHTEDEEAYNICLGYIVELVGSDGDASFFENVLGFTKNELIGEGMEWVYE